MDVMNPHAPMTHVFFLQKSGLVGVNLPAALTRSPLQADRPVASLVQLPVSGTVVEQGRS